jgi:hypothetical protein
MHAIDAPVNFFRAMLTPPTICKLATGTDIFVAEGFVKMLQVASSEVLQ